jgi:hypothetical protein
MRFVVILATITSLLFGSSPAQAATPIIMIQETVKGQQDANMRLAVRFVDKYTKSRFKYGKCVYDRRCIIIKTSSSRAKGTGWSEWKGSARKRVTITVNPGRGNGYMSRLFVHEIGHAMFLPHSSNATNLMYARLIKKNGTLVPFKFTTSQKTTLRRK